jgi:alginate production protein
VFGEALDPDLSNVGIVTVGVGVRPSANFSLDVVWHKYRLHKLADEIRNSQITAQMAQVDSHLSKAVGEAVDIVIGMRNVFGVRRLGLDFRFGWFFPGQAYLGDEGTNNRPSIRLPSHAVALVAKVWW